MKLRTVTRLIFITTAVLMFVYPCLESTSAEPQRRARSGRRTPAASQRRRPRADYSNFSHRTVQHKALACDSCHKIPTPNWSSARSEEPFPDVTDYPDHDACLRCHQQQFFVGARPVICSVCHTNVSPRDGRRFAFQNPNEDGHGVRKPASASQFTTRFPHDVHQDVMASVRPSRDVWGGLRLVRASFQQPTPARRLDSCTICHESYEPRDRSENSPREQPMSGRPAELSKDAYWPERGTFKTTPTNHASCFNCHWRDGGERPLANDCASCHELVPSARAVVAEVSHDADKALVAAMPNAAIRAKWLKRKSAKFEHEIERHEERGCTACHLTITGADDLKGRVLDVPLLTCAPCHIDQRTRKELNVEVGKRRTDASFQCTKCHVNYGVNPYPGRPPAPEKTPIPASHADAVPTPTPKRT